MYHRKSGQFIGMVDDSPLNIAATVNDTETPFAEAIPKVATHCNMWFFLSYDRSVAMVVHPEFVHESDSLKPFNMAMLLLRLIGSLALRGFTVTSVCTDSHQSNIVSERSVSESAVMMPVWCWNAAIS